MKQKEKIIIAISLFCIVSLLFVNTIILLNIGNRYDPDREKLLRVLIVNQVNNNGEYVKLHKYNIINLTDMGIEMEANYINLTDYTVNNQLILAVEGSYILFDLKRLEENITYETYQPFAFNYIFNETEQLTVSMMVYEGNWFCLSLNEGLDVLWVLIGNDW